MTTGRAEEIPLNIMDCIKFEESISEYLDGTLRQPTARTFAAHALQCRACRALMDEVKLTLNAFKESDEADAPSELEAALMAIPQEHGPLDCSCFEELITEFLDGFVPASVYHRFESHAEACAACSALLSEVVLAVAACHSVHTYEEMEASEPLVERLDRIMMCQRKSSGVNIQARLSQLVGLLVPLRTQGARWSFATGFALVVASFAFLLYGFSDNGTVEGIYRQAHVKAAEIYSQGADIYAQKEEVAARIEKVGMGLGEIWDTLGGAEGQGGADQPKGKSNPGKHASAVEKN